MFIFGQSNSENFVQGFGIEIAIAALYLGAAVAQGLVWRQRIEIAQSFILGISLLAWFCHTIMLFQHIIAMPKISTVMWAFLTSWAGVVLSILIKRQPLVKQFSTLLIWPCAAASILLLPFINTSSVLASQDLMHIVSAGVTMSVLLLSGGIASLLVLQECWLHRRVKLQIVSAFPPLQTTEQLLFYVLKVAVILLTLMMVTSSVGFGERILVEAAVRQKLIMVGIVWSIFVLLLLGHKCFGWRGMPAALASLLGVVLSMAIYVWSAQVW